MSLAIDPRHGCGAAGPEDIVPGLIPVTQKASSSCCGAVLAEGGTDEDGHTCTECQKPAEKVLGPKTAHWTCGCGVVRHQVVTEATDDEAPAAPGDAPSESKGA